MPEFKLLVGGAPGRGSYRHARDQSGDIEDGARLVGAEQFGPVLPVIKLEFAGEGLAEYMQVQVINIAKAA